MNKNYHCDKQLPTREYDEKHNIFIDLKNYDNIFEEDIFKDKQKLCRAIKHIVK